MPPARAGGRCDVLLAELADGDLYDLQERYVLLFDRTRSLSLHLFEHVHGESRDRGQAMVDLHRALRENGLQIDRDRAARTSCRCSSSFSPPARARGLRTAWPDRPIFLRRSAERLQEARDPPTQSVFRALVALAAAKPRPTVVAALAERARSGSERPRGARCRLGGRRGPLRPRCRSRLSKDVLAGQVRGPAASGARHAAPAQNVPPSPSP